MAQSPLTFYRLWCGRKRYTGWLPDKEQIWRIAIAKGLAFGDERSAGLGPLTWIEIGERARPRSKTVVIEHPCRRRNVH